jgi:hypothetical protein
MQNNLNIKDLLYSLIRCNMATPSSKNIARLSREATNREALAVFALLHFVANPKIHFG